MFSCYAGRALGVWIIHYITSFLAAWWCSGFKIHCSILRGSQPAGESSVPSACWWTPVGKKKKKSISWWSNQQLSCKKKKNPKNQESRFSQRLSSGGCWVHLRLFSHRCNHLFNGYSGILRALFHSDWWNRIPRPFVSPSVTCGAHVKGLKSIWHHPLYIFFAALHWYGLF